MLFNSLIDEFDSITFDVMNANNTTFDTNIARWFELLDEDQFAFKTIRCLDINTDFDRWDAERQATMVGMFGQRQSDLAIRQEEAVSDATCSFPRIQRWQNKPHYFPPFIFRRCQSV